MVCLVRHGETPWSLTGQHTGVTDLGLTAHGENESRALAPRLRDSVFMQVLVSPRLRARQTCELAGLGAVSQIEPDLAEWDYGEYEGRRSVDIRRERPDWNIWRDGCPGGESPADVSARADRLIQRLCAMQDPVVLFSHGQFGAALAARWIGLDILEGQHFPLHTASVSLLGIDPHHPGRRTIGLWNEVPCRPPNDLPGTGVPLR
jgi:broad specificity phosphatase PhoE